MIERNSRWLKTKTHYLSLSLSLSAPDSQLERRQVERRLDKMERRIEEVVKGAVEGGNNPPTIGKLIMSKWGFTFP